MTSMMGHLMGMAASTLSQNLTAVRKSLGQSQLIAVSKYVTCKEIKEAYDLGQRAFGENRVKILTEKSQELQELNISWHFIGNLQKNKINTLLNVPGLVAIHSVDSLKLWQALGEKTLARGNYGEDGQNTTAPIDIFLQANTSGAPEKNGFKTLEELSEVVDIILKNKNPHLNLKGLMTMSKKPGIEFERDARECFHSLQKMRDTLVTAFKLEHLALSMGMSSDYQWALEYGADYVRIGSKIF